MRARWRTSPASPTSPRRSFRRAFRMSLSRAASGPCEDLAMAIDTELGQLITSCDAGASTSRSSPTFRTSSRWPAPSWTTPAPAAASGRWAAGQRPFNSLGTVDPATGTIDWKVNVPDNWLIQSITFKPEESARRPARAVGQAQPLGEACDGPGGRRRGSGSGGAVPGRRRVMNCGLTVTSSMREPCAPVNPRGAGCHVWHTFHGMSDSLALLLLAAAGIVGLLLIPLGLPGLWLIVLGILSYGWLTHFRTLTAGSRGTCGRARRARRGGRGMDRIPLRAAVWRIQAGRLGRARRRPDRRGGGCAGTGHRVGDRRVRRRFRGRGAVRVRRRAGDRRARSGRAGARCSAGRRRSAQDGPWGRDGRRGRSGWRYAGSRRGNG